MLIGFIGLGKLGMPCAEAVSDKGHYVNGYDILPKQSTKIDIKDSIYIKKLYNIQSQEILLKLSFHNLDENINISNHIHLIKFLETTNEKDKNEYDILINKKKDIGTSGRLVKKSKKIFKRSDNDYFNLSFNINNKNILLFNLKLFNEDSPRVENWNNNLDKVYLN